MPASPRLIDQLVANIGASHIRTDRAPHSAVPRLPFAFPALDAMLDGGLPRGAITEIVGRVSSGRTTLGYTLIASATRAGEYVAWVDVPNALDPESVREAGANVERILWLHPRDRRTAVRAAEYVLATGGFRLVVLDLDCASTPAWVPASAWMRMARAAVHRDAAVVVLGPSTLVGSFAALSLEVRGVRRVFSGQHGPCPMFEGAASAMYLRKRKYGPLIEASVDLFAPACV